MPINEYESQRLSNIEVNKQILCELGLERPPPIFTAPKTVRKKITSDKRKISRRFNKNQNSIASSSDSIDKVKSDPNWRQNRPDPHQFGNFGFEVGQQEWLVVILQLMHRLSREYRGARWSIALSGGYEDEDTGSGGRDLKGTKVNPKNLRIAPKVCKQPDFCHYRLSQTIAFVFDICSRTHSNNPLKDGGKV
ncbi:18080_t:CDS:2 [Dentiscutata erythropus]|uniref:18080_t:CDS:1 n=1 Tax=Dentiscutata erythropus TaxID=1348616 RepID=A0A9N9CK62_9GLOM|nr:18080_t:CDS:2 [Dentiscutata erythropus]